jgi:ElaB/YqjD/DUF883 family membrane-anchored ribosome-binding protein
MSNDNKTTYEKVYNKVGETAHTAANRASTYAKQHGPEMAEHFVTEPAKDLLSLAKDYAREKPDVAACWCFAIGVIVGWKLKP